MSLLARRTFASSGASLATHADVEGEPALAADLRPTGGSWRSASWMDLSRTPLEPGRYEVRVKVDTPTAGGAILIPPCAGRMAVRVDGEAVASPPGPVVVPASPGPHAVVVALDVSAYERRVACGEAVRTGSTRNTIEGLGVLTFDSPQAAKGGGKAVVYVPPGGRSTRPRPLLVGLHPWNGSPWTYAAYAELLDEARARDVVLLMPSALGNSLYTADAEGEVLRAIDAVESVVSIDLRAVSLWGASMGGAGATTIGFHHPDRFASVTSFFGDSRYDLSTYVHTILPSPAAAHAVNALDVVDNARHLPVWLIHGEDDHTSPIRQSVMLAEAMRARGFAVRFDRAPAFGHSGALVAKYAAEVVAVAASRRVPAEVSRVTYRSVRADDLGAFGVRIVRASPGADATIDVERRDDGVHVLSCSGVRSIRVRLGALGTSPDHPPRIVHDDASCSAPADWEPAP